ncbi:MAG TPA: alpha/beta hydrolase, partial [Candidatus Limnocylindria bacterium]|nr:alpha/beta hydrolase [Candidatus Limnocylindria bacterium]
ARMWDEQVTWLRGLGWRVAAPSLPGFGGTPDAGEVMSMGAAADRCLRSLETEGIDRAVVCGLSMGGYVAFEIWRMARQRVAGLVLANTRSGADAEQAANARRALAARLRSEGNGFLVADPPPLLAAPDGEGRWPFVRERIAAQPAPAIAAAAEGMAERPDSTPDLGSIDVPALVLTSSADALIAADVSLEMARHLPTAETVTIDGAGHLTNLEAPQAFQEALGAFLDRFRRV